MDLTKIFGEFTGQTLKNPNRNTCDTDDVYDSLQEKALANGLTLRVWWPDSKHSKDRNMKRLNVHVSEDANGGLKIDNNFYLG